MNTSSTQLKGMVSHGQVTNRAGTHEPEAIGMSDGGTKKRALEGPGQNVLLGLGPPGKITAKGLDRAHHGHLLSS